MTTESAEALSPGSACSTGQIIGGYRVVAHLGSGGMGHVYEAERLTTGQRVALKVPHAPGDARVTARILREARYAASIDSPHVARIIDADVGPAGPFIVMERLHGETLAERLLRVGKLPWREAAEILVQACHGVSAIHEKGLVHRDLKPSNLFLAKDGEREQVKVIDLGLARLNDVDDALTRSNVRVVGTVAYAAPEQLRAPGEVTLRADLWSLGVTLHHAMTGALPFRGTTMSELIIDILQGSAVRATEVDPDLPERLQAVIDECLRRSPEARPTSALALADGLERALTTDGNSAEFFRTGRTFRILLRGRLFILIWVASPVVEDIDLICSAGKDARAMVGQQLVELVLPAMSMGLTLSELRAAERMVALFPEFTRNFEQLFMVIDAEGFAFRMLEHAAALIAQHVTVPWRIGRRKDILPLVSAREGVPVEELDRLLRVR